MGRRQRVGFVFREVSRVIVIGRNGDSRAARENAGDRRGDERLERIFHDYLGFCGDNFAI